MKKRHPASRQSSTTLGHAAVRAAFYLMVILSAARSPVLAQTHDQHLGQGPPAPLQQIEAANEESARHLAAIMVGEARGEDDIGMRLVGEVVLNRVAAGGYGRSVREVAFRSFQFSCMNQDSPVAIELRALARGEMSGNPDLDRSFDRALPLARALLRGQRTGLLPRDAYHYAALELIAPPRWARRAEIVLVHGGHTFYAGVDGPRFALASAQ